LDPVGEGGVFDPVLRSKAARTLAATCKGIQQAPALVRGEPQPPDLVRPDQSRIHRCRISDTYHPTHPRTYRWRYGPRLLNAALDEVRRSEWRKAKEEGKRVIKGCRFLITAGRERLGEQGKQRLAELTALNAGISAAYILKEDFRSIYTTSHGVTEATRKLRRWCATVTASGIVPLCRFARSLLKDLHSAAAFFRHRITSGPIEAFNNQISRLIHRSCGIANLGYLFLKMRAQSLQQI
jgi:hypothetical protein